MTYRYGISWDLISIPKDSHLKSTRKWAIKRNLITWIWLPENQTIKVQSTSYYHAILASWWTILGQFSGLDTSSSPQPPDWTIYPKKSNFNPLAGIFAHFWRDSFFSQPFCGEHFVYCQPPDWDIWYNLTFTTFLGWTQEQRLHFSGRWVWCPPLKKHAHWNASINFSYI